LFASYKQFVFHFDRFDGAREIFHFGIQIYLIIGFSEFIFPIDFIIQQLLCADQRPFFFLKIACLQLWWGKYQTKNPEKSIGCQGKVLRYNTK